MEELVVVELAGYEVGLFAATVIVSWHFVVAVGGVNYLLQASGSLVQKK